MMRRCTRMALGTLLTFALLFVAGACSESKSVPQTAAAERPFWVDFRRPAYADVALSDVEGPLLAEIEAAQPEIEQRRSAFSAIPIDSRHRIPEVDDEMTRAAVNAQYLEYRRREIEAYRRTTRDTGAAKAAGERFIEAYIASAAWQPGRPSDEEIRRLGEKALELGSQDPLVRAYLARSWMNFGEHQRAHDALADVLDEIAAADYPPNVLCLACQWLVTVAKETRQGDVAVMARTYATIDAVVRLLAKEADDPGQRFLRWHYFYVLDNLSTEQYEDLVVACIQAEAVPRWHQHMLAGDYYSKVAWEHRGHGFANTVSEQAWTKFHENQEKAAAHYTQAWHLHPEYPEAATAMIGQSTAGGDRVWTPRDWFQWAVAAQWDYDTAYESLINSLLPRWGGSHTEMLAFAHECLDTKRWDTCVPFEAMSVLRSLRRELGSERPLGREPEAREVAERVLEGLLQQRADGGTAWGDSGVNWGFLAGTMNEADEFEKVCTIFEAVGDWLQASCFDEVKAKRSYVWGRAHALTGPAREHAVRWDELLRARPDDIESSTFDDLEMRLAEARETDPRPVVQPYFDDVAAILRALRSFHGGQWAELSFDADLSGWRVQAGDVLLQPDGTLHLARGGSDRLAVRLEPLAHFPPPFMVAAEIGPWPDKAPKNWVGLQSGATDRALYKMQPLCGVYIGGAEQYAYIVHEEKTAKYGRRGYGIQPTDFHQLALKVWPGTTSFWVDHQLLETERDPSLGRSPLVSFGWMDGRQDTRAFRIRDVRIRRLTHGPPPGNDEMDLWPEYYRRELELDPHDTEAFFRLAVERLHRKDFAAALELFEEVQSRTTRVNSLDYYMGLSYLSLHRVREALPCYERAIERQPNLMQPKSNLAWILAAAPEDDLRDAPRSLTLAQQACELSEYKHWMPLCALAAAHAESGDFESALAWIEKSIENAPESELEWLEAQRDKIHNQQPLRIEPRDPAQSS